MVAAGAKSPLHAALEQIGPHDHLCSIYDTKEEQYAVAVPFIKIGLDRGERCIYIADSEAIDDAREALSAGGIDVDGATRSGALILTTKEQTYLRRGSFDPDWMFTFWNEAAVEATADGFPSLRATGETEWVLRGAPGIERWMEYESRLTHMLAGSNCFALCQYNRPKFPPELILDVIRTHPIVIYRGVVCRNFYFVPAEDFLHEDRAREAERLLGNIRDRERMDLELRVQQAALQKAHDELEQRVRQRTAELSDLNRQLEAEVIERRQVEQTLREREEWLRMAQRTAGLGIADWDVPARRATVTEEFCRLYGLDASVTALSYDDWLDRVHPEDRRRVGDQVTALLEDRGQAQTEFRVLWPDGATHWVSATATAFLDPGQPPARVLSTSTDVTEWKRAEEAHYAAQKMESIGVLAGGLAHDFNNLLLSVIGNASLALEMARPGQAAVYLERIIETGERAAYLTNQMLAYSGRGRFVTEAVDLSELARQTMELVQPSISKRIAVRLKLAAGLPAVPADRGQMQQVILSLVLNAAEAVGDQDGTIEVSTGVESVARAYAAGQTRGAGVQAGDSVYVQVGDTGCGMDEATKSRIFEPFFTTKFTGRGLGLAAVSGIVRGHNGAIEVTSAPGRGSTFPVLFPAARQPAAVAQPQPRPQEDLRGSGTVLVVDDEAAVRKTVQCALEHYGYQVLLADSGPAAIEVVRQQQARISLVVLDLSMPGMSGQETLPQIRKLRPDVEVVVTSGYTEAETMRLFEGARVAGFIQKPYTPAHLAEKVKMALTSADPRRQPSIT
jgi:PAS domain S-box-containing protein